MDFFPIDAKDYEVESGIWRLLPLEDVPFWFLGIELIFQTPWARKILDTHRDYAYDSFDGVKQGPSTKIIDYQSFC